jgi:AcrR family transcriptional regulator
MSAMPDLRVIETNPRGGTRARLLRAAMALLEAGGYDAASIEAIAERAELATEAFYDHFPSKAALFVEVFRAVGDQERDAIAAATADSTDAASVIEGVVSTFAGRALTRPRLAWALVYEPVEPLVDAERLAYRRDYTERLAAFVRDAVDRGELPDQDPDLTAAALTGAIIEALVGPLAPVVGRNADPDAVVASLTALCRRAVGAEPG